MGSWKRALVDWWPLTKPQRPSPQPPYLTDDQTVAQRTMKLVQGHRASKRDPSSQSTTGNAHKGCWELQAAQPPLLLHRHAHTTEIPVMQSFLHDVIFIFPLLSLLTSSSLYQKCPSLCQTETLPSSLLQKAFFEVMYPSG